MNTNNLTNNLTNNEEIFNLNNVFNPDIKPKRILLVNKHNYPKFTDNNFNMVTRNIIEHILSSDAKIIVNYVNHIHNIFTSDSNYNFVPYIYNINFISSQDDFSIIYKKIISDKKNIKVLVMSINDKFNKMMIDLIKNYVKYKLILIIHINEDIELFNLLNKFDLIIFENKDVFNEFNTNKIFNHDKEHYSIIKFYNSLDVKNISDYNVDKINDSDAIVLYNKLFNVLSWNDNNKNYILKYKNILEKTCIDKSDSKLYNQNIWNTAKIYDSDSTNSISTDIKSNSSSNYLSEIKKSNISDYINLMISDDDKIDFKKLEKDINEYIKKFIKQKKTKPYIFDTDYMVNFLQNSDKIKLESDTSKNSSNTSNSTSGYCSSWNLNRLKNFDIKESDLYYKNNLDTLIDSSNTTNSTNLSNKSDSSVTNDTISLASEISSSSLVESISSSHYSNFNFGREGRNDNKKINIKIDKKCKNKIDVKVKENYINIKIL